MRRLLESLRERQEVALVVGLGISGIESARFLLRIGIRPRCIEAKSVGEFRKSGQFIGAVAELREAGAEIHFGIPLAELPKHLDSVRLCIFSPGVPFTSSVESELSQRGVEWCGEFELGLRLFPGKVVTITGSNGKSTTATLTSEILEHSGVSQLLCGNIGVPVVSTIARNGALSDKPAADVLVVEASSYQLAGLRDLRIHTHAILNLSENHLERHGSMEQYRAAKASPLAAQSRGDLAILNADDPWIAALAPEVKGELALFGAESPRLEAVRYSAAVRYGAGQDEVLLRTSAESCTIATAGISLIGRHNRLNVAAAALAASSVGARLSMVEETLREFVPLEHRLERVTTRTPGIFINDSKATTVAAVVAALAAVTEEFSAAPLWLLLGGRAKVGSWLPVVSAVKAAGARLRSVVCFGEDGARIRSTFDTAGIQTTLVPALRDAVGLVRSEVAAGDVVLFSPGCASFDAFRDFEERGAVFKSYLTEF